MVFVETSLFTHILAGTLSDDDYRALQEHLAAFPEAGKRIQGARGIRKIYWSGEGTGKRGGIRVTHYWWREKNLILILFLYPKSERDDLSPEQFKTPRQIVDEEYP